MVDADSVAAILRDELGKPSMKSFVNGKVIVSVLRTFRDWKKHTEVNAPVTLEARPWQWVYTN